MTKRLIRISLKKIVINSSIEDTIDKIAREEAVHDNTAGERVGEFTVDPLIEAIQSRGTTDEEAEGPRFESSPH